MLIGRRTAACPSCGSLSVRHEPGVKGSCRCDRCDYLGRESRFLSWQSAEARPITRPPVLSGHVQPLIADD